MAVFVAMNCWRGFQHSRALSRLAKPAPAPGLLLPVVPVGAAPRRALGLRPVRGALRHVRDGRRLSLLPGDLRRDALRRLRALEPDRRVAGAQCVLEACHPSPPIPGGDAAVRRRHGMSAQKKGLFVTPDGRNVVVTFALVSSLFLLWGFCNGMIDVMDKHFQNELHLTPGAVGLGAVRALPRLLPDGAARRLAGDEARLQGRHHRRPADGGGRRLLVHPGHADRVVLGVPARRLRDRRRADVPRDDRQSLHDGARRPALRGHAHQPGPVLQRHRLDLRPDRRRRLLLRQGRERARARARRRCGFRTPSSASWSCSWRPSSSAPTSRTSRRRTTTTSTTRARTSRTRSGRIRTS